MSIYCIGIMISAVPLTMSDHRHVDHPPPILLVLFCDWPGSQHLFWRWRAAVFLPFIHSTDGYYRPFPLDPLKLLVKMYEMNRRSSIQAATNGRYPSNNITYCE